MGIKDISFQNDVFNRYFEIAQQKEKTNNFKTAKLYYYRAAEIQYIIAKLCPENQQQAHINKADSICNHANNLPNQDSVIRYNNYNSQNENSNSSSNESNSNDFEASEIPNVHFSDIVGLEDVKKLIRIKMIEPFLHQKEYLMYGKKIGGGVLLYGPPGNGKTMIAKAIACEVGAHFYAVKSSDIVSKWVGESERNIAKLFETANKQDKAIIFVDEMDSLFSKRGKDSNNDSRVNEFLQQMDGFSKKNSNLLFLGATNRPWDIDDAALRSGRFSEKIYVPLPDIETRKFLFQNYLEKDLIEDVNFDKLAEMTEYFSAADIAECSDKSKDDPLMECIRTHTFLKVSQANIEKAILDMKKNIIIPDINDYINYSKGIKKN